MIHKTRKLRIMVLIIAMAVLWPLGRGWRLQEGPLGKFTGVKFGNLRPLAVEERKETSRLFQDARLVKVRDEGVAVDDLAGVVTRCFEIVYDMSKKGEQSSLIAPGELNDFYGIVIKTRQALVNAIETGRSLRRTGGLPFDVLIAIDIILTGLEDGERLNDLRSLQDYFQKKLSYHKGILIPITAQNRILHGEDSPQARDRVYSYMVLAVASREPSLAALHFSFLPKTLQDAWFNNIAERLLAYLVDKNEQYKRESLIPGRIRRGYVRKVLDVQQFFGDLNLSKHTSESLKIRGAEEMENKLTKYQAWAELAAPDIMGDFRTSQEERMAAFYGADMDEWIQEGQEAVTSRDSERFCVILSKVSKTAYAGFSIGSISRQIDMGPNRLAYMLSSLVGRFRNDKRNLEVLLDMVIIASANNTGIGKLFPKATDVFDYIQRGLGFEEGTYFSMLESRRAIVRKGADVLKGQWLGKPIGHFERGIDALEGLFRSMPAPAPAVLTEAVGDASKKSMSQIEQGI